MDNAFSKVKVRCPECAKYVMASSKEDGSIYCQCPNCKVVFYSKCKSGKEKTIHIKYPK